MKKLPQMFHCSGLMNIFFGTNVLLFINFSFKMWNRRVLLNGAVTQCDFFIPFFIWFSDLIRFLLKSYVWPSQSKFESKVWNSIKNLKACDFQSNIWNCGVTMSFSQTKIILNWWYWMKNLDCDHLNNKLNQITLLSKLIENQMKNRIM